MNYWIVPGILNKKITFELIALRVCNYFKISIKNLKSKKRNREFVDARCIFSAIAKDQGYSYNQIKDYLNKQNHATIIHQRKNVENVKELNDIYNKLNY